VRTRRPTSKATAPHARLRALSDAQLGAICGGDDTLTIDGTDDEAAYGYIRVKKLNSGG
jgi:hypothetical protein